MNKEQVFDSIVEAVHTIEQMSNRGLSQVDLDSVPIRDFRGFDSLSGLEATVVLAGLLGIDVAAKENLFVTDDGKRAKNVQEIVDRVDSLIRE